MMFNIVMDERKFFFIMVALFVMLGALGVFILTAVESIGKSGFDSVDNVLGVDELSGPLGKNAAAKPFRTWTVNFKDGKFSPGTSDIKQGDMVVWTNLDADEVWPASGIHPTHDVYPEKGGCPLIGGSSFDSCGGLKQGQSWSFKFNFLGVWRYHDHLRTGATGVVNVSE